MTPGFCWQRPAHYRGAFCAVDRHENGSVVTLCGSRWSARSEIDLAPDGAALCSACVERACTAEATA